MPTLAYALFPTPLGYCGIAWGAQGLTGVQLPEANEAATRARMAKRFPQCGEGEPPPDVRVAITAITALLDGKPTEPTDLSDLVLDMDGVPPFHQRVYTLARGIPPGETLTYGEMARLLGEPGAARAVGQALGANPFAPVVPCHRILAANGRSGGFSAPGGVDTKLRMLLTERARFNGPGLFD
ncbi:methylated-DNA--[protein]-cysteine S-methyltransferase [Rhodoferax saidenbachensis]|uniref:Cysteine methyltransferase n=1 Tax=Rhodoferax saidenbachensis TaxID=1484693 RepID=A0A1P8KCN9_9BURK|nr:methylated-DNA--[protein]-cysteine S-methyltransferase [Rhodoferax saidenbachensis]APW43698.1 cysteine methyltransferase [Rhodoferax saidenbachensis]